MGLTEQAPETAHPAPTPVPAAHHRPALLAAVLLGGVVGTLVRTLLESALPPGAGAWPWTTFLINVFGSAMLGGLLESLARRGPDRGLRRLIRLGGGTGVIGGFTTYSTFAVEADQLALAGRPILAIGYAVGSIAAGLAAAGLAICAARRMVPHPTPSPGEGR